MDTELLRTFLEIEKTKQFGRAAENLYLTPAAVSARIRQLEGLIGFPLFERHRSEVRLTPSGEQLKPYAESILKSWNRALQESPAAAGRPQQLSIGGTPNLWDFVLQEYLHSVHRTHPDLTLRAECHDSTFLTSQLQARLVDMVVLFDPLKLQGLARERLMDINLMLVSSQSGITAGKAPLHNYVQVDWGAQFGIEHTRILSKFDRPTLYASTGRIALDFLLSHGGSVYLPEALARSYLDIGKFHLVDGAPTITQAVYVMYLQDSNKKSLMQAVTNLLVNTVPTAAPILKP
ncbi:MAG: DNA-binding transcriptional LysR family regulator [Halieaceae bacterium]|jgi:DNA-binding transcriptional LysR family regulator